VKKSGQRTMAILEAYLMSRAQEYIFIEERLFNRLNLSYNEKERFFLFKLAKRVASYYLEFLRGNINRDELEKHLKREVRFTYMLDQLGEEMRKLVLVRNDEEMIKKRVEFLFGFAKPIFLNFEDANELINALNSAEHLAIVRESHPVTIILNFRDALLKNAYPQAVKLRSCLEGLVSNYSLKKRLENEIGPAIKSLQNIQDAEGLLSEARNRLKVNPEKLKRLQEIEISLRTILDNRVREILTSTPAQ